jgi:GT2 family glycosyltransferase
MIPATSQIGIGITTKDRWDDLESTLKILQAEGLDSLETIVIDDGSVTALPSPFKGQFPWVTFMRFESSQGLITQRNRLAQLLSTPLILQLDDDSFPVAGSLAAAASWLMERPGVCALALRMINRDAPLPADFATKPPFAVRSFVGCCVLVKREPFLALGGYEERLEFNLEELEFCTKALQQGQETYAYPAVVIRHRFAPVGRNVGRRTRQYARNYVLICLWYYPFPISHLRAIRYGPVGIVKNAQFREYWKDALIGWLQGMLCYFSWPQEKKRLSLKQFHDWENLHSVGDGSAV